MEVTSFAAVGGVGLQQQPRRLLVQKTVVAAQCSPL